MAEVPAHLMLYNRFKFKRKQLQMKLQLKTLNTVKYQIFVLYRPNQTLKQVKIVIKSIHLKIKT